MYAKKCFADNGKYVDAIGARCNLIYCNCSQMPIESTATWVECTDLENAAAILQLVKVSN